jgi:ATP-dependent helicase/DNAse subunit B
MYSFSKVSKYVECPRAYFLRYVQRAPDSGKRDALDLGVAFHNGMEAACRKSLNVVSDQLEAAHEAVAETNPQRAHAVKMLDAYIPLLKLGENLKTITKDSEPLLEVPFQLEENGVAIRGYIDAIMRTSKDEVVLIDWKTRGSFTAGVPTQLDAQLHLYAAAAQRLGIKFDRVAQVQFAKITPAMPTVTKKGAPDKRMGKTTREIFDKGLSFWGLAPDEWHETFANKIVAQSEFVQVVDIDPMPELYLHWFQRTCQQIADDKEFIPTGRAHVCKWCGYHEPCMKQTQAQHKVLTGE